MVLSGSVLHWGKIIILESLLDTIMESPKGLCCISCSSSYILTTMHVVSSKHIDRWSSSMLETVQGLLQKIQYMHVRTSLIESSRDSYINLCQECLKLDLLSSAESRSWVVVHVTVVGAWEED